MLMLGRWVGTGGGWGRGLFNPFLDRPGMGGG